MAERETSSGIASNPTIYEFVQPRGTTRDIHLNALWMNAMFNLQRVNIYTEQHTAATKITIAYSTKYLDNVQVQCKVLGSGMHRKWP